MFALLCFKHSQDDSYRIKSVMATFKTDISVMFMGDYK